jgi:hypothetical protein
MEADHGDDVDDTTEPQHQALSIRPGRSPSVVLFSQVKVIHSQGQQKGLLKGNVEFCNTRNGTTVVKKEMADSSAIRSHVESSNLPYFTSVQNPRSL